MKKEGRGTIAIKTCKYDSVKLCAIKWFDNWAVSNLTTYEAGEPLSQVRRWYRKGQKELSVECPSAVAIYNKSIGVVNLLDGLLSYYRILVHSKKWYHCLIWQFLDVSVVQAWLLHRKDSDAVDNVKVTSLKEFKLSIAQSLLKQGKREASKRGRPSVLVEAAYSAKKKGPAAPTPSKSVRKDGCEHWQEFDKKKGRCWYPGWAGFPKVKCFKCDVCLCFTATSNCFRKFHDS